MNVSEFEQAARRLRARLGEMSRHEAIAAACRGSADPAALAWLAEALELQPGQLVLDVGAGVGGPATWYTDRYGARLTAVEPAVSACQTARAVFGLHAVAASADSLPFSRPFDAAICLGVLSVVDDPAAVLAEMGRLCSAAALLVWCSATGSAQEAGGSRFPTADELLALLDVQDWEVRSGPQAAELQAPPSWDQDADAGGDDPAEREVGDLIRDGRIAAQLLVADRRR